MSSNRKIIIVGHKNPDTDSICSAIAYADIKNRTTDKRYVAKRAGQINEETAYVLDRFGMNPPGYISNVGTQVKDMEIQKSPDAYGYYSVKTAWNIMRESGAVTLLVKDKEDRLEGLITIGDVARIYMDMSDNRILAKAQTQYQSIADTVDGKVVVGNEQSYFTKGKVMIGAAHPELMKEHIQNHDLVLMANREEDQKFVIRMGVSCVIVCLGSEISDDIKHLAAHHGCVVITSPLDTYTAATMINQSIPIRYIMRKENLVTFSTEDYTDNIKDVMVKYRHRSFPVISKKGKCIGTISRRNFMGMRKKQLILVDHNEKDQAVDNIENAEILEIIDHHRIGNLETIQPVIFRNQPVGCTATIMYQLYEENKLEVTPAIAGLLCAAIISDTLMFRSPTCTVADKMAAGALALIADINIKQFATDMFKAGSNLKDKSPEVIFYQDYKKFMAEKLDYGVGQISSLNAEELSALKEKLIPYMKNECGKHDVSQVYFMLTDIMEESTELLYYGENCEQMIESAFHVQKENGTYILHGIVSRKKQLIPALMEAAQEI